MPCTKHKTNVNLFYLLKWVERVAIKVCEFVFHKKKKKKNANSSTHATKKMCSMKNL